MAPARSARARRNAAASVAAAWRRRCARICSIGAGASCATATSSPAGQLLEQLAPGGRGPAAGQLAADLVRCLSTP
ncbi:hypothetical protein [Streptomyces sp. PsTaAH-124]|uniref:hypothetical protein n=1 Tax=Streptomyces sp. PsTaAH-124 TaxID=1157638 RepID=UPI0018F89488|nr:hypothetical protein [Streptomyces sp. PsTaAH-124]